MKRRPTCKWCGKPIPIGQRRWHVSMPEGKDWRLHIECRDEMRASREPV